MNNTRKRHRQIKRKSKSKIRYTGIGAKKDGFHTEKEFLNIAKKHFKDCKSAKCYKNKACKMRKTLAKKMQIKNAVNINDYLKAIDECNKCIKKHKCITLKEYIKHSGAIIRKS
jgi:hypothetical protein